ncbi:MAG TPA: pyruvate:ferredoxin (flavodoxin) oxidoreductase [Clostridiaceae bacterium]|nr:pyruvate:ferredoxin (flavodoxin) oxidoreductase [Clostridiaceae bacterium]
MAKKMKTMDGNTAAAYVSYAFTEVAAIYPITPSSPMAELTDEWAANGQKNIFGQPVKIVEMQSEAGAAGAVHGSLQAGALTTTYTASQGLLLMIPNMYKIAGELLPGVFQVSARALASHALSIFGDHSDVMAARQTGFALLAEGSVQEVADLSGVAHLSAIKGRIPFLNFFDGFRTSHEVQKIEVIDYEEFAKLLDWEAVKAFKKRALNPEHPVTRGTAQNPDIFFQAREACNPYYEAIPDIVADYMKKISALTGRNYKPFVYYGDPEAEYVVVAMGSVTETCEEVVDYLRKKGEKVGLLKVHLYRPFSSKYFFEVMPKSVKKIAVLDRTKEPGSAGEPLYLDVKSLYYGCENKPVIVGGRYGLGSKDTKPNQIVAVFENLKKEQPKDRFTIGIVDDVSNSSLPVGESINTEDENTIRCKFWGFGSDGTVGANKSAIKIIGDNTGLYAQGYFSYDSKKSGGVTVSHLRFGKEKIRSTYLIDEADYIACHNQAYVGKYDLLEGLKKGGDFVLNCQWDEKALDAVLPGDLKRKIANDNINFYIINATDIAREIGLGSHINMIMQAAFFKIAKVIPIDEAVKYLKDSIVHAYGKKGQAVLDMNFAAVDRGIDSLVKVNVPESWKNAQDTPVEEDMSKPEFIRKVMEPMNAQMGDKLPVSAFKGIEDGTFPSGTSAYEKRGIAVTVPEWQPENCIQCNQCSFVCPHAAIRPFLLDENEKKNAPEGFKTIPAIGPAFKGHEFRIQVSVLDCYGCNNCIDVCPAKEKALVMKPLDSQMAEAENWKYAEKNVTYKDYLAPKNNVKNSQFAQPLIEFSGACAGCGETPYIKAVTQLFGDRMMIANATGCSSIWGGSAPATVYCTNREGKGPAWANSLFEDNAEYGLGMYLGVKQIRDNIEMQLKNLLTLDIPENLRAAAEEWIASKDDGEGSKKASKALCDAVDSYKPCCDECARIIDNLNMNRDYFVKKSQWILGGDGWAYDIGYGGLDHVLASGEDVNILVFDTEVYSNTGGQASKSTPTAAVAKFAASGKRIKKKDLGLIAATYGYVYVAQVAIGANMNQFVKAIQEAEAHKGPSLIIAYAPCINHGIKGGMTRTPSREKLAVESGYWHLWRYVPELKQQGKNPFILDSKEPTKSFQDFIKDEVRYSSLKKTFPDVADELFQAAERDAKERYETYKKLASGE